MSDKRIGSHQPPTLLCALTDLFPFKVCLYNNRLCRHFNAKKPICQEFIQIFLLFGILHKEKSKKALLAHDLHKQRKILQLVNPAKAILAFTPLNTRQGVVKLLRDGTDPFAVNDVFDVLIHQSADR